MQGITTQPTPQLFIIFGRPGAGKSSIANEVAKLVSCGKTFEQSETTGKNKVKFLDLDVCIPEWMKLNFQKGIYPTLDERESFALDACKYVEEEASFNSVIDNSIDLDDDDDHGDISNPNIIVISFSFVNNDLRDVFRERFKDLVWILVDTNSDIAEYRIATRDPNHFYKGGPEKKLNDSFPYRSNHKKKSTNQPKRDDNSDWKFDEVHFQHIILNGEDSVEQNANHVLQQIIRLR